MDADALAQAMGNRSGVDYDQWVAGANAAMLAGDITTQRRASMFLAQCGEESGGLRHMVEIASGSEYEGRRDLGNVYPGDGVKFKGRGPIQITGRHNYGVLSVWANAHHAVPTPVFFLDNPEALARPEYVWLGPVWYWTVARPQLNALSDAGNIYAATRAINGGLNGIADRVSRYRRCLSLGDRILPSGGQPAPVLPKPSKDELDMATMADVAGAAFRVQLATLTGAENLAVTRDQAKMLHDAWQGGATPGLFVRFSNAANPNAVYQVLGNQLGYIDADTYKALGSPIVRVLGPHSPHWGLPVVPGTADYRKKK